MVTFVCYHCDKTLKKNQVERHNCGRAAALICIDCHVTFYGMDYKAHISCLTEQEKRWGEYAKKKPQQVKNAEKQKEEEVKGKQQEEVVEKGEEEEDGKWKGWKNEIKAIIREEGKPIEMSQLREKTLEKYRHAHGAEPQGDIQDLFQGKVKSLKKVKLTTYVSLDS